MSKSKERLALEARANELNIVFPSNIGDEKLKAKIEQAEKELSAAEAAAKQEEMPPPTAAASAPAAQITPQGSMTQRSMTQRSMTQAKKIYAFCRVLGGVKVDYLADGEKKFVILKSAKTVKTAGDGQSLKFDLNASDYGVSELSVEQYNAVLKEIGKTKMCKKGFVFFSHNLEEGRNAAINFSKQIKNTGVEQLNEKELEKLASGVKRYTQDDEQG